MTFDARENQAVCASLRSAGVAVDSVYDLVNRAETPDAAFPVLATWLVRVKSDRMKEGIARALSARKARAAAFGALVQEFSSSDAATRSQMQVKWAVANAIAVMARKEDIPCLLALTGQERHGQAREMLVVALGRLGAVEAVPLLLALLGEPELRMAAARALVALKGSEARTYLEALLSDVTGAQREQLRKMLARHPKGPYDGRRASNGSPLEMG